MNMARNRSPFVNIFFSSTRVLHVKNSYCLFLTCKFKFFHSKHSDEFIVLVAITS